MIDPANILLTPNRKEIYFRGPPVDSGPLPALIYFALSGEESLFLDPINQPAAFLEGLPIRVFSWTIPEHDFGKNPKEAMKRWAEAIKENRNLFHDFITLSSSHLTYLIEQGLIDASKIAVSGLSRGGFLAAHFGAIDDRIPTILAYAPITRLEILPEFQSLIHHPNMQSLSLYRHLDVLVNKRLRFYIGNRDTRVSTESCCQFVLQLAEMAYSKGIRSPQVELMISPSIGHKGHGTPSHVFRDGINWIRKLF